ncbi:MAG: hypothetical protein IPG96_05860 [Proteobacteria bacterium]|nr:hypothetical protein [Pseudomonadota bacterium]
MACDERPADRSRPSTQAAEVQVSGNSGAVHPQRRGHHPARSARSARGSCSARRSRSANAPAAAATALWAPLSVRDHEGGARTFSGAWRRIGQHLLTVVADPWGLGVR